MKQRADEFAAESTPVIDLRKHGLEESVQASANDASQNWDNDKTEVYMESDEDEITAALIDGDGESFPITAFPFVLGRGAECDMVLNGKGLSRKHVEIVFQSGRFVINDLDSLNGLKVNGYKVSRVILEEGDVVKLGEINLTFTTGDSEAATVNNDGAELKGDGSLGSSDPFGSNPKKKILIAASMVGVLVAGGGLYTAMNLNLGGNDASGQIVSTPNKMAPQKTVVAQSPAVIQAPKTIAPPTFQAAPPPSISMSKPAVDAKPVTKPVAEVVKPVVAVPKAVSKPKSSKNEALANKLLSTANARYLDGDAEAVFVEFKKLESDSRLPKSLRSKLKAKHETLAKLFSDYSKGQKAYVSGNKDGAFQYWTRFLEKEGRIFKKSRSLYADQVVTRVVDEYVSRGNSLSQSGDYHKAYKMWQKAVTLGDSVAAKIALDSANNKSKQLYRKALRLEYVNSTKAKALWQEVVGLVPPGTEYYTKASSKLAWYERWGG